MKYLYSENSIGIIDWDHLKNNRLSALGT